MGVPTKTSWKASGWTSAELLETRLLEGLGEILDSASERIQQKDETARRLERSKNQRRPELSLHQFLKDVWHVIEPDIPLVDSWCLKCLCDHAQAALAGYADPESGDWRDDLDRLIINCPPGVSKSAVFSIVAPCWAWTFRSTYKFLFLSFSDELATQFGEKRRTILQSEYYSGQWPLASEISRFSHLGRELQRRAKDTAHETRNVVGGEMRTTTVGGKVTGFHPQVVIFDDPIEPPDGKKLLRADPRQLREFVEWYRSKFVTRGYADVLRRKVILVGQRACLGDPTDVLLQEGGDIEHLCLAMEYNPAHTVRDPQTPTRIGFIDPREEAGELLCPALIGRDKVNATKRILGNHNTAAQFQQAPVRAQGNYIKAEWFQRVEDFPENIRLGRSHRHWDLAATDGAGDFTVGLKLTEFTFTADKLKTKFYMVEDVRRGQWGPAKRDAVIRNTAQFDTRQVSQSVEQEPGSGGKTQATMLVNMLKGIGLRASTSPAPRKGKFMAADAFVAAAEDGRVFALEREWTQAYIDELTSLERDVDGQTDDQLDGSSGAFNQLAFCTQFIAVVG